MLSRDWVTEVPNQRPYLLSDIVFVSSQQYVTSYSYPPRLLPPRFHSVSLTCLSVSIRFSSGLGISRNTRRHAMIYRYEQLLALPAPPGAGASSSGTAANSGKLQSCLTCGKMFTTTDFLQQHILRKHAHRQETNGNAIKK